ncbi:MAG: T9SS type A sorting domain-containing protein [Bacteroidetes bacterium]|nr:T9SS type A sorting domain-containing protein [Bacteroidota bacterium]
MKKAVFIIFSLLFSSSAIQAQTWEFVGLDSMVITNLHVSGDSIWAGTAHRVGNQDKSGLYFSTDSGNNWVQIDSALVSGVILGFDLVTPSTLFILKGSCAYCVAGTLYKSTNNGETWDNVSNNINSPIQWFGISPFNKNEVYALTYNPFPAGLINILFKSTDGGVTWEQIGSFPSDSHGSRVAFALDLLHDSTLYAGVSTDLLGDYFFKSTDKGDNWFFVSTPPIVPKEIYTDYFIPDRIYLYTFPQYISNNGGINWLRADSGLSANSGFISFYQDNITTSLLYNLRNDGLYNSKRDYIFWVMIADTESLPIYFGPTGFFDDRNMKNIFIEPIRKELFLGTAEGIYKTTVITSVNEYDKKVLDFSLSQNYPNPFNPITTITYQIPKTSFVTIKVYDVLGNEIATLVNEEQPAGSYEVEFQSAIGPATAGLASGMYFYQLKVGNYVETKKMLLLK